MTAFDESVIEQAVVAWLEAIGWQIKNGTEIAPDEPAAERDDYGQVFPARRLRESLLPLAIGDLRLEKADRFVESTV